MHAFYGRNRQKTSDGSAIITIADDRTEPGQILVARTIAAMHDGIVVTESVILRLTNGARIINIYQGVPAVTSGFVSWQGHLPVPEGWYIEASLPAAANTEVMRLDISGYLCDTANYWGVVY